jgi:POLQ-like helicase
MGENTTNSRRLARTWPYPRHSRFVEHLRQAAKDWFAEHEFAVHPKYGYRLAEWADWPKNIIVSAVATYIQNLRRERGQGFALHDYIHHGLSSQALLFNLVGPLVVRNDLEPLREAVRSSNLEWPGVSQQTIFEYEDRSVFNEDSGQPTSIDLVIGDPNVAGSLFIECKLVETEFGGCSVSGQGDCDGANPVANFSRCYLHYIGRRYWSLLSKHGFLEGPITADTTCVLANHYQFFRLVLFALERNGTFVLLSDDRSPTFWCKGPTNDRGLMPFVTALCTRTTLDQGRPNEHTESG